jgi:ankyrin repeat protein
MVLEKGRDIYARNNKGYSPLDTAIQNNSFDVLKLLEKGAGVNIITEKVDFEFKFSV